jgi:hypothetical protein
MKDAKGHGSDSHGGTKAGMDMLYRALKPPSMIPGYQKLSAHQAGVASLPHDPDALVSRLRAGVMPNLSNATRAPGWIERLGKAARGRNPD